MENTKIAQDFYSLKKELHAFAMHLIRDKHLAEDLFQDTAVRVFNNVDKFHSNGNFKAWVMVIMRNTFINDYRKKKRRRKIYDCNVNTFTFNSLSNSVENEGEKNFLMRELMSMINDLDEGIKKPFVMSYEGFKYEEIATEMKLPLGTVKSRIFQARKQLKKHISLLYKEKIGFLTAA
ncbi:MAG: RNA polymerase sigma-70 factor (ECF subfamily) [Saprospiraceae bacterium]|jgi:RNA polymerase sigma-70 factor (ECF subfamily)